MLNQALGLDEQSRNAALKALEMEQIRGNMISATPYGGGSPGQKGLLQSGTEAFLGSAGGSAAMAAMFTSDVRLKTNITPIGKANGFNLYSWDWNEKAIELGLGEQATYGVMAQEVIKTMPSAVRMFDDGYYRVQYDKIFGKPSGGTS